MNYFTTKWSVENNLVIPPADRRKNHEVDIHKWVKKKQNLDYVPWGISRSLMHSYNANLDVGFECDPDNGHPFFTTPSGVYLMAFVFDKLSGKRTPGMMFPVRGFGNKSEPNPSIDLIGNAVQRAYSKVIAQEVGFAWSLYSRLDESIDLDDETLTPAAKPAAKASLSVVNSTNVGGRKELISSLKEVKGQVGNEFDF